MQFASVREGFRRRIEGFRRQKRETKGGMCGPDGPTRPRAFAAEADDASSPCFKEGSELLTQRKNARTAASAVNPHVSQLRNGKTQRGGPASHKDWAACLHPGHGSVNAGNPLIAIRSVACQSRLGQSVRLNSGVAMSSVPMPKTDRYRRSYWMATKPPSFSRTALNP